MFASVKPVNGTRLALKFLLAEINGMIFDPQYQPLTYNQRESLINPPFVMVADNTQNWASVFQFN